jgi:hypothetical protein
VPGESFLVRCRIWCESDILQNGLNRSIHGSACYRAVRGLQWPQLHIVA